MPFGAGGVNIQTDENKERDQCPDPASAALCTSDATVAAGRSGTIFCLKSDLQ
jgi:hypothetical protein